MSSTSRDARPGQARLSPFTRAWRRRHARAMVQFWLYLATAAIAVGQFLIPGLPAVSVFAPLIVLGGLYLRPRPAAVFFGVVFAWGGFMAMRTPERLTQAAVSLVSLVVVMAFMLWISRSRHRLGVTGMRGDTMFTDLRARLSQGGTLPELPEGWYAESAIRSANGSSFSGDFLVTTLSRDGKQLEITLVDVSGKGGRAGTRALQLSGAFGGLLGAVRPEEFLGAANNYVLRHGWTEGFATCVHIAVDLVTGEFDLGTAGHPPAAQYHAGSGRWHVQDGSAGPVLGLMPDAPFRRVKGQLAPGDALLLYTDGVVESRGAGLADGLDRMLGTADRHRTESFRGLAQAILKTARAGEGDDRAAVLISWS